MIASRFEALHDELAPQTVLGSILVHRVAMLSVRLDRAARQEAVTMTSRVENAEVDFDEARFTEVHRLAGELDTNPRGAIRKLRRMPEGVDQLLTVWQGLRDEIGLGGGARFWHPKHVGMAEMLTGRPTELPGTSRFEMLNKAVHGDFRYLPEGEAEDLDDPTRRRWALGLLTGLVDAEIADLQAHRLTLDPTQVDRERARAADRALIDTSKEALLTRKYEAATERAMYRALRELREVEEAAAIAAEVAEAAELGSFVPEPEDDEPVPRNPLPRRLPPELSAPRTPEMVVLDLATPPGAASTTPVNRLE